MDNIGIDLMHEEYQEKQKEAADEIEELHHHHETETVEIAREPSPPPSSSSSTDTNFSRSAIHTEETVPVSSETEDVISRDPAAAGLGGKESIDSSSSSDFNRGSSGSSSGGISSLYQPGFTAPTINYEKEGVDQKLVAVIGREFDQPMDIARNLQDVLAEFENADLAKFVPFMVKRKTLLRGSFSTRDLGNHDLICLCYNASEARILLTGQDGFYTTLLKQIEALLGKQCTTVSTPLV
ncbi:MAG: hypothetical protein MJE68_09905 [Proteobacteria bacterium]|nr:hypothetical protein [Pseudomonadota bacterium]